MSLKKLQPNHKQKDIFSSIPSSEFPDLFSGLDIGEMCVPPLETNAHKDISSDPMFALNSLENVNIRNIAAVHHKSSEKNTRSTPHSKNNWKSPFFDDQEESNIQLAPVNLLIKKASRYTELSRIREKIISKLAEKAGQALLLTSANDGTGQSLIAATIAFNMAQTTDKSILLLESNMRRPSLHSFFGIQQGNGLANIFKENLPWQSFIQPTELSNLHLLTAGTVRFDFSNNLQSHHLPDLLKTLTSTFDLVIIDSSPILTQNKNNIDTVLLTALCDYSLLVVNYGLTNKEELKEIKGLVQTGNGHIDGIIYNHHKLESNYSSFYTKFLRHRKEPENG